MKRIALFGAAGKMGTRISQALRQLPQYQVAYVESGPTGEAHLREAGLAPAAAQDAIRDADAVILAVPDIYIGAVATEIVKGLKPGAMVICLDPAAPYAGELPAREDVTYFVMHPCHPSLANKDLSREALEDYFGGVAPQALVCALMQGPEADYARGVRLCSNMFAPVSAIHRISVEQMALLEPAMAETVALTCLTVVKEAVDEVVARGVPRAAATDFILGHLNVSIAILFGLIDARVSDGARLAVERAKATIFQPDWKRVFELDDVMSQVKAITSGVKGV